MASRGLRTTLLGVLALAAMIAAVHVGTGGIPSGTVMHTLFGGTTATETQRRVILELRLPRVLAGALVGAAFGLGAVLQQGGLRSRELDPGILATATGAVFGAVVAERMGAGLLGSFALSALSGGVATAASVLPALRRGRLTHTALFFSGGAVNVILGSLAGLALFLGPGANATSTQAAIFWFLGGRLGFTGWDEVRLLAVVVVAALGATWALRRALDAILMGEEQAVQVGVEVARMRWIALGVSALVVAAAVQASGILLFLGLLAAYVAARLVGPSHGWVAVAAPLSGATAAVLADAMGRVMAAPGEIPMGLVTALVGGPLFFLVSRRYLGGAT